MEHILTISGLISILTLTFMEIVLGIDNIIFISILTDKLPKEKQQFARNLGLGMALGIRVLLLFSLSYIIGLTAPIFTIFDHGISGRDLILLLGGLFLLYNSTSEIHEKVTHNEHEKENDATKPIKSVRSIIIQITLLDVVFSFDSILTAVGLVKEIEIMIIAVVFSMIIMMALSGKISAFINERPTLKVLALSFLLMIGTLLVLEAFHVEVPKGYIYFAMAFSFAVELLNLRVRRKKIN